MSVPNSAPVSDQRPWTAGCAPLRRREPNVRRRSARARCDHDGVAVSFGERRGANASLVASPAHTRSQSRVLQLLGREAGDVGQQVGEEARARAQPLADRLVDRLLGWLGRPSAADRSAARRRGSTAPPARSGGRARPRRPTPPRRSRTAGPSTPASRRRCGAAARRAPTPRAAARGPGAARAPRAGDRGPRRPAGGGRRPARTPGSARTRAGRRARSRPAARPGSPAAGGAGPRGHTTRAGCRRAQLAADEIRPPARAARAPA